MLTPPASGFFNASEYAVSALPWVTSSITSGTAVQHFSLPKVSKFINLVNTHPATGTFLRMGFTENGVNNGNYFLIPGGANHFQFDIRIRELWFRSDTSGPITYSVCAGLTTILAGQMPDLTGSLSSSIDGQQALWSGVG